MDQELPVGESVDVIVRHSPESPRRSAVDVLAEAPGQRVFKTMEEVESHLMDRSISMPVGGFNYSAAGAVHLGNFPLLQKWLSPNFTASNKQRWNRSLGMGRLMNPAGTAY